MRAEFPGVVNLPWNTDTSASSPNTACMKEEEEDHREDKTTARILKNATQVGRNAKESDYENDVMSDHLILFVSALWCGSVKKYNMQIEQSLWRLWVCGFLQSL